MKGYRSIVYSAIVSCLPSLINNEQQRTINDPG